MLFLFVVFFTLADVGFLTIALKPDQTNVFSTEGSNISLSCTYTGSVNSLPWGSTKNPDQDPSYCCLFVKAVNMSHMLNHVIHDCPFKNR
ncbi:hypothetical protein QTP70_017965 [Hemibagrus guttatus]|uniref:Ig-like domain-containing protein n=1 Tax=Hemibagrus guttatus TaxID=175788 RepID=A0AAE0R862_9TELE|nr:hypothetical protein QTP70_017965 [Hemibagrus guttatus]